MLSFSDYRKQCIKESLHKFSARGSSQALFDILKIDLTESAGLPELLSESIVDNTEFNVFRKDCRIHRNMAFENICNYAKYTFYDQLMNEAEDLAAMQPTGGMANPESSSSFKSDLKAEIIRLVGNLKNAVLGVSSPVDQGSSEAPQTDPNANSAQASAPQTDPNANTQPVGAQMGGSQNSTGSSGDTTHQWPSMAGSKKKGWLRPKDGYPAGIMRSLWNPIKHAAGYLKKNWYGENRELIESMFLEQNNAIATLIDDFANTLIKWVDERSPEIASDAGMPNSQVPPGAPVQSGQAPGGTNAMGDRPMGQDQEFATSGTKQELQQKGLDPDVVNNPNNPINQAAKQGDPEAEKIVNQHTANLKSVPQQYGLSATKSAGYQGGPLTIKEIHIDGVSASDYQVDQLDKNGNVVGKRPVDGYKDLLGILVKKVASTMNPEGARFSPEMKSNKFPSQLYAYVKEKLGDYIGFPSQATQYQGACTAILLGLGAQARGVKLDTGSAPGAMGGAGSAPGAETQPAPGDRAMGGAGSAPGAETQPAGDQTQSGGAETQLAGDQTQQMGGEDPAQANAHVDQAVDYLKDDAKKGETRISHVLLSRLGEDGLRSLINDKLQTTNQKVPYEDLWNKEIVPLLKSKVMEIIDQDKAASTQQQTGGEETQSAEDPVQDVAQDASVNPTDAATQDQTASVDQTVKKPSMSLLDRVKAKRAEKAALSGAPTVDPKQVDPVQNQVDPQDQFLDFKQDVLGSDDLNQLVSMWGKLAAELGGTPSEQEIAQKASLPPDDLKAELLGMKKKALGMDKPVGESFLQQIVEFNKLIKESNTETPTKQMRKKLGLPS